VEQPKFEGDVMKNEDEFQKSVQKTIRPTLLSWEYHNYPLVLITCILSETAFWNPPVLPFQISIPWPWIGLYGIPSTITHWLYLY